MSALGIDHGKKRVGVALCEKGTAVARPLIVLDGRDRHKLLTAVQELVGRYEVDTVVVGHPLTLMGESGPQARQAEDFARRLEHKLGPEVGVHLWDERLSSQQVDRVSARGGRGKSDGSRDMAAAVVVLQSFLDRTRLS